MTAEKVHADMLAAAHEADVCQWLLDEMTFRGVTDSVALAVVRVRRNAANQRYEELRPQYAALWRSAHAAAGFAS